MIPVKPTLDYIAGFFDGEGSVVVRIVEDRRYRAGYKVSVRVSFTQKDRRVLEAVRERLGMGRMYHHVRDDTWYLEVYRRDDLRRFVDAMRDRVIVKRGDLERLERVLDLLDEGVHSTREGLDAVLRAWSDKGG